MKQSIKNNTDLLSLISGLVILIVYFILDMTILHLSLFLFTVIVASLTIFIITCIIKMTWDAVKPKPDDMNSFIKKYKPWELLKCTKCNYFLENCTCHPIPCLFCDEEFGFVQDWNIHIDKEHEQEFREAVLKEVNKTAN